MRYVFSGLLFPFAVALALSGPLAALTPGGDFGRVVELEVPAPSLAGNLIGTVDKQAAAVYLPPRPCRALRLPARRDDAFRKAAREDDPKAQGKLDL